MALKHAARGVIFGLIAVLLRVDGAAVPEDCQEHWASQRLDHFRWHGGEEPSFQQRYFVCDKHWSTSANGQKGPIFFYAGNESPVTAYMKSAGLMFENRESFGALVLFIEHRYYGDTQPFGPDSWKVDPSYLTVEQAMADYTALLHNLTQSWGAANSPIIAFGGSYGGMLAAWMRRHYPHIIAGAVAASAPVGSFPAVPGFKPSAFWDVVTRDASPAAGAAPDCVDNTREAFRQLFEAGGSAEGRQQLQATFGLCEGVEDEAGVLQLAYWAQGAFDAYAMGNFPFASDYMVGEGQGELPAWPMRVACEHMSSLAPSAAGPADVSASPASAASAAATRSASTVGTAAPASRQAGRSGYSNRALRWLQRKLLSSSSRSSSSSRRVDKHLGRKNGRGSEGIGQRTAHTEGVKRVRQSHVYSGVQQETGLLDRLASAAGLLYNASGTASCYSLDLAGPAAGSVGAWDYQVCTQFMGQEQPYFPASASSMFWDQGAFDWGAIVAHCKTTWGVEPSWDWMAVQHGGLDWTGVTNIVFSNGQLDPWSVFGVLEDVSDTVVAVIIPDGAHHLDLMYSRPDDSDELRAARQTIMRHVLQWIEGRPVPSVLSAASGTAASSATSAATGSPSGGAATSSGSGSLRDGYEDAQHARVGQLLPAGVAAA